MPGAIVVHGVTRGGLLETLLEIASLSAVSIEIDLAALPVSAIVPHFQIRCEEDELARMWALYPRDN